MMPQQKNKKGIAAQLILLFAIVGALIGTTIYVGNAGITGAATITLCNQTITTPGTYDMTSLTCASGENGVIIQSENVTLNCGGALIRGAGVSDNMSGILIENKSAILNNCNLQDFNIGIYVVGYENITVNTANIANTISGVLIIGANNTLNDITVSNSNYSIILGFNKNTLIDRATLYGADSAVNIINSINTTLLNSNIFSNRIGLLANNSQTALIQGTTFDNNNNSAYLVSSSNFKLDNNIIKNSKEDATILESSDSNTISNNTFRDNNKTISVVTLYLKGSKQNEISDNTFINSFNSITLFNLPTRSSDSNTISRNNFSDEIVIPKYAIYVQGSANKIVNNIFGKTGDEGIVFVNPLYFQTDFNIVANNTFVGPFGSGFGLLFLTSVSDNDVWENSFLSTGASDVPSANNFCVLDNGVYKGNYYNGTSISIPSTAECDVEDPFVIHKYPDSPVFFGPSQMQAFNDVINFTYNASDDGNLRPGGIRNCTLSITGASSITDVDTSVQNNQNNTFQVDFSGEPDGDYSWNVTCYDTSYFSNSFTSSSSIFTISRNLPPTATLWDYYPSQNSPEIFEGTANYSFAGFFGEAPLDYNITIFGYDPAPPFNLTFVGRTTTISSKLLNESAVVFRNAPKGDSWVFINYTPAAEAAFIPGSYVRFENHNATLFQRYVINDAQVIGSEILLNLTNYLETLPQVKEYYGLSPGLEADVPSGTKVFAYNSSFPTGFFNETLNLTNGLNRISVYGKDGGGNLGPGVHTFVRSVNTHLELNATSDFNFVVGTPVLFKALYYNITNISNPSPITSADCKLEVLGTAYNMSKSSLGTSFAYLVGFSSEGVYPWNVSCTNSQGLDNRSGEGSITILPLTTPPTPTVEALPLFTNNSVVGIVGYSSSAGANISVTVVGENFYTFYNSTTADNTNVLFQSASTVDSDAASSSTQLFILDDANAFNFQPGIWVQFGNHNRSGFFRYNIAAFQKDPGIPPKITISPALETDVPAGTPIYAYNYENPLGNFTLGANLSQGNNSVAIFNVVNGIPGPNINFTVYYDSISPEFNLSNIPNITNGTNLNFIIYDDYGLNLSTLQVIDDNGTANITHVITNTTLSCIPGTGAIVENCTWNPTLSPTTHNVTFNITDLAGNNNYTTINLTVDAGGVTFAYINDEGDVATDNKLYANWSASGANLPIAYYEVALGTASCTSSTDCSNAGVADTYPFTNVADNESINTSFTLQHGIAYYFNVKAVTAGGSYAYASTDGILFSDITPPQFTNVVRDSGDFIGDVNTLFANWSGSFEDNESGISSYEYSVGTAQYPSSGFDSVVPRTQTAMDLLDIAVPQLIENKTYYVSVKAKNPSGSWSVVKSTDGITTDFTPPSGGSVDYNTGTTGSGTVDVTFNWGSDSISGFGVSYLRQKTATYSQGSCGSFGTPQTIKTYANAGSATGTETVTLQNGKCYKFDYLVYDNANNSKLYTQAGSINNLSVDTTPPIMGQVYDEGFSTGSLTQLSFNWDAAVEAESVLTNYSYVLHEGSQGGASIKSGIITGNPPQNSITLTGLSLQNNQWYYLGVKAENSHGAVSSEVFSDGILTADNGAPQKLTVTQVEDDANANDGWFDNVVDGNTNITALADSQDFDIDTCRLYDINIDYDDTVTTTLGFDNTCSTSFPNVTCNAQNLPDGAYTFYITCKDQQGNRQVAQQATELNITVDEDGPDIVIIKPESATLYGGIVPLEFNVTDISGVASASYEIRNSSGSVLQQGSVIANGFTANFNSSKYIATTDTINVTVFGTDNLGHKNNVSREVSINNIIPTFQFQLQKPITGELLDQNNISSHFIINVTINNLKDFNYTLLFPNGSVAVQYVNISPDQRTSFSVTHGINTSGFPDGNYTLKLEANDNRSNTAEQIEYLIMNFNITSINVPIVYALEGETRIFNITPFFIEPRGEVLNFTIFALPNNFTAEINSTSGVINITSDAGFTGTDTMTVQAQSSSHYAYADLTLATTTDNITVHDFSISPPLPYVNQSVSIRFAITSFNALDKYLMNITGPENFILNSSNFTQATGDDILFVMNRSQQFEKNGTYYVSMFANLTSGLNNTLTAAFEIFPKAKQNIIINP